MSRLREGFKICPPPWIEGGAHVLAAEDSLPADERRSCVGTRAIKLKADQEAAPISVIENSEAFKFDPERALQRRLSQGARPAETAFPDEFVSPIVKAGTAAAEKNLQLQELAESAMGVQKLRDEKARAVQELAAAHAKILRLEAERREMSDYFEQQRDLVHEQEAVTEQMLAERTEIDAEMESLVRQRSQVASDRAQLIIEISRADGVRAELQVARMDVDKRQAAVDAGFEALKRAQQGDPSADCPKFEQMEEDMLAAETLDLLQQREILETAQLEADALKADLLASKVRLDTQQEALDAEKAALDAEKSEVASLVADLRSKREELDQEQEACNTRWAQLDQEAARLARERADLDAQLALIADAWGSITAERTRLEILELHLNEREAALGLLGEEGGSSCTGKGAAATPSKGLGRRLDLASRGDSPRDLADFWRMPLLDDQAPLRYAPSSLAASEIDSLEEPRLLADSAASMDGYTLSKERAAFLKEERMRLWAATGNPLELEKALKQLQAKEAELAYKEMQLEARAAIVNEQDRRFEAEEMRREWALAQREAQLAAKEAEIGRLQSAETKRTEEVEGLQSNVQRLKQQLEMAMAQCASSEKALMAIRRARHGWARRPDTSIFTSLRARGLSVDDFHVTLTNNKLYTA